MRNVMIVGLVAFAGVPVVASASYADTPHPVVHQLAAINSAATYWTEARMLAAKPLEDAAATPSALGIDAAEEQGTPVQVDPVKPDGSAVPVADAATERQPLLGVLAAAKQKSWTKGGQIAKTAGKLFGTGGGGADFVASANVVTSKDGDIAVSVGHAVIDEKKRWSKNLMFVPGYAKGGAPFGKFPVRAVVIWSAYTKPKENDPVVDFSTLVLGRPIQKTVGGQGIKFNTKRATSNVLLGYPGNGNGGETLQYCSGPTAKLQDRMKYHMLCDMGGGSSGGPWFQTFDQKTGYGYQVSTHSIRTATTSFGPNFGKEALAIYRAAEQA